MPCRANVLLLVLKRKLYLAIYINHKKYFLSGYKKVQPVLGYYL